MVRLMLVLSPAACVLAGIGISSTLRSYMSILKKSPKAAASIKSKKSVSEADSQYDKTFAKIVVVGILILLSLFVLHCVWVTSEAYSSPSIVLAARQSDGSRAIFDDFREAYYWLRQNTDPNAKVMSWWDYGYQITAIANRSILVDNNTWNNTHIATVGMVRLHSFVDSIL